MTRTTSIFFCVLMLATSGCGGNTRQPIDTSVDCSVADPATSPYEFKKINYFEGNDSGWYEYADPTKKALGAVIEREPLGVLPNGQPETRGDRARLLGLAYQEAATLDSARCGDTKALHLEAYGYNFWGAGFADWQHEANGAYATDANGNVEYDGISFWARSATNTDKTFTLYVDDGRTLVAKKAKPVPGIVVNNVCQYVCSDAADLGLAAGVPDGWGVENAALPEETKLKRDCVVRGGSADTDVGCSTLPPASSIEDLNGDTFLGPGEIAAGTDCTVPPRQELCDPACYAGGVQPPAAAPCVPVPRECGNQFHTYITTTDEWQLFLIPWSELVQWPCPNRLAGGIDPADIRKFEIKFRQGTHYELWLSHLEFYRRRADAGS